MSGGHPDPVITIEVECYAGHRGEETPRRFHLGERTIEVTEVLDQWLATDHRYFKLRGKGGRHLPAASRRSFGALGAYHVRARGTGFATVTHQAPDVMKKPPQRH